MVNPAVDKFIYRVFYIWQVKPQLVLIERDLWDVISGDDSKPLENNALIKWFVKDPIVIVFLRLSLSDAYLNHIDLIITSKAI